MFSAKLHQSLLKFSIRGRIRILHVKQNSDSAPIMDGKTSKLDRVLDASRY